MGLGGAFLRSGLRKEKPVLFRRGPNPFGEDLAEVVVVVEAYTLRNAGDFRAAAPQLLLGNEEAVIGDEAAEIDGAGRLQRIFKITLPLLKPTIIIMFLLNIGGILAGGGDQIMGMTNLNPLLLEKTDTIATFVYRSAIVNGQFESASAITLYQSIFGFILVLGSNLLVKKVDPDYALF